MRYLFTISFILLTFLVRAQDKVVTFYADAAADPPDLAVTLLHINAEISFVPELNVVRGNTVFTFYPNGTTTDSIVFSTPGFKISSVSFGKDKASWLMRGNNLVIYPPEGLLRYHQENKLSIVYEAAPLKGAIYFIGWRPEEEGKRKVIWAHRPNGWLPYMDARIRMDMFYTFDKKYNVFANGERINVRENSDNTRTWHYRMDKNHPFFSTSVVIGDYDWKNSGSEGGVPLEHWYYKGDEAKVPFTYQYTEAMMDFFEKELNFRYPYPVYRQAPVIDYMYGAMETTTATVFGDFMLIDPHAYWQRNYINTNAHEMAHQWFGNYICHLANKDVWLTESFGTYYAKIFERSIFGEDHYQNIMNEEYNTCMSAARSNSYPVGGSKGGVARIYQKGSLVMGMLRYVMGDTAFRQAVTSYLKEHPYKNATQEEFFRAVYEASGKSYSWFFNQWILRGGEPHYKIEWRSEQTASGSKNTVVHIWQVHETNDLIQYFRMPVVIEVHYKDGSYDSKTFWVKDQFHEVLIPDPANRDVEFVLFDPGRNILKKTTFSRSYNELAAQAVKASGMIDRFDALTELRTTPLAEKKELLLNCYAREKFHLIKSEIILQLADDRSAESIRLFEAALADTDANVRKTVISAVFPLPSSLKDQAEKALDDFSYLNRELALQNLCYSFPSEIKKYLDHTKDMTGWRGLNIRMRWLYLSISSGSKEYLEELKGYTGEKYEFETRINAFSFLKKLLYQDEMTMANAKKASEHWNNKLSGSAREYLKFFSGE